jgi:RNA polymerase sigma-70 factor (ECF subfamily)
MSSSQTPASLLERLRIRSDREAWSRFVQLYGPFIYRRFQAVHLQHHDACDLSQEVLTAVAREMPHFRYDPGRGSFRNWLRTIIANRLKNFWRNRTHDRVITGDAEVQAKLAELEDRAGEPACRWEEDHDGHVISRVLMILKTDFDPTTWQAFWKLVVDELPSSCVAQELNLSKASVYAAKSRVLRRLRQELSGILD